jgi:hypothetical protein
MVYALWTRQTVADLILLLYGIKLAVRTMGLYLVRWGFTPQEPMKKADEQSPVAVKQRLADVYSVIAPCAKVEGAEIHWGDETALRGDEVRGRSCAMQGQTPVVRVNNQCHGLSFIACVTNKGQRRWKASAAPVRGLQMQSFSRAPALAGPLGRRTIAMTWRGCRGLIRGRPFPELRGGSA